MLIYCTLTPPPRRRVHGVDAIEQSITIGPDELGVGLAVRLALGQPVILHTWPVPILPLRLDLLPQPVGSGHGETVEGMADCLADALQAIQRTNGAEHMGRIGSLPATAGQPLLLATRVQEGIEHRLLR